MGMTSADDRAAMGDCTRDERQKAEVAPRVHGSGSCIIMQALHGTPKTLIVVKKVQGFSRNRFRQAF